MSHFSRIKTQIVDKTYLLHALNDLGFQYEEGKLHVAGSHDRKMEAEIVIRLPLSYDVGLKLTDGSYEVVADWAGVKGLSQKDFIGRLTQRYAYHAARSQLEEQGFTLVEEIVQNSGQIRLVLRRMGE
jgi:hypothetical protein